MYFFKRRISKNFEKSDGATFLEYINLLESNSKIISKCPSNCLKCKIEKTSNICIKCSNDTFLIDSKFCVKIEVLFYLRSDQSFFLKLFETVDFNSNWLSPLKMDFESISNLFLTFYKINEFPLNQIQNCGESHYLSNQFECFRCPFFSSKCTNNKKIIECEKGYYINKQIQKCIKCPPNCTSCDVKGCNTCRPGFKIYHTKCIECADPNCKICISDLICFQFNFGFFY